MAEIKLAATIKVIRQKPEGGIEVLLLRRNKKLKFAPRFWVFPGGKIDPHEIENNATEMEAALIAAAREAKEEADLDIIKEDLKYYVNWTTPVDQPYRYKTYFFHVEIPYAESEVKVDNSEILEHRWYTPEAALAAASTTDLMILPPTYISLMRIRHCQTYEEVVTEWSRCEPHIIVPRVAQEGSIMHCMYEGDAGFEKTKYDVTGPRHRLVADYAKGDFKFLYKNCDNYFPISGGHH